MTTGAELARALRDLADLVEPQARVFGVQIEPLEGLVISVRVAGARSVASGSKKRTSADRMRELRAQRRAESDAWSDALSDGSASQSDAESDASDAESNAGGLGGGPVSDRSEKRGKERGIIGSDLSCQQQELANVTKSDAGDALGDASQVTPVRDASRTLRGTDEERAAVRFVFEAWKQDTGHHRSWLDRKRGNRILARLREGKTKEDLVQAIVNRRNNPFLMGENEHGTVYDALETLLRDAGQVEKLLRLTAPAPRRTNGHGSRPVQPSHGATGFENARILR